MCKEVVLIYQVFPDLILSDLFHLELPPVLPVEPDRISASEAVNVLG